MISRTIVRRPFVTLFVSLVGLMAYWWWSSRVPALSAEEIRLVGAWCYPEIYTPLDYGVPAGPMSSPCAVLEFSSDRTFRSWLASADDSSCRYLLGEGRWGIEGGRLCIVDMPLDAHRIACDIKFGIEAITGRSLGGLKTYPSQRIREAKVSPFRIDENNLMIKFHNKKYIYKRLPGRGPEAGGMIMRVACGRTVRRL